MIKYFTIPSLHPKTIKLLLGLALIACTIFTYWSITSSDFINFDDNKYVSENLIVQQGISLKNIVWAFGFSEKAIEFYWHPLTWLSHMLDCQLFGLNAGAHHFINLLIHLMNTVLLFTIFYLMTYDLWKSFFIAALFALHPINVDSVAWIAERKNVLSSFFWMLTMLGYVYYARKPDLKRYFLIVFPLILGMISKPMLITLPFALLLLDFWPLGRLTIYSKHSDHRKISNSSLFQATSARKLILEKLPLLALALTFTIISIYSIQINQQILAGKTVSLPLRFENAVVTYMKYIGKIIWPQNFSVYYPFPETIPAWEVILAGGFLAGITILALICIKKAPYLIVGWLWYLGTLFPVSGIHQHARWPEMADRWMYIPGIGLFLIITWGGSSLISLWPGRKRLSTLLIPFIIVTLIFISQKQVSYWKNSQALFSHALDISNGNNYLAHFNLGTSLASDGNIDQAISHYIKSLKLNKNTEVENNLGRALAEKGQLNEAIKHFQEALNLNPQNHRTLNNMGNAYIAQGENVLAITFFEQALNVAPENSLIQNNLAKALIKTDQYAKALSHLEAIISRDPSNIEAIINLGDVLARQGRIDEAISHYQNALQMAPARAEIHNNMGILLLKTNRHTEAEKHFQAALTLNPGDPLATANIKNLQSVLEHRQLIKMQMIQQIDHDPDNPENYYHLGVFYHEIGETVQAIKNYHQAIDLNPEHLSALFNLACIHTSLKEFSKAEQIFKQLTIKYPGNKTIYYNLACVNARQNRPQEAVRWLIKAIDHGYNNWEHIKTDRDLANIRSTRFFQDICNNK